MAGSLYLGSNKVCPVIGYIPLGCPVDLFMGYVDTNGKVQRYGEGEYTKDIILSGFSDIGDLGLGGFLMHRDSLADNNVVFRDLLYISGYQALTYAFLDTRIKNLSFPLLEEITGSGALEGACYQSDVEVLLFPKLSRLYGSGVFFQCFEMCKKITDIYFNALTTNSFGSYVNQFDGMFDSYSSASTSGTCTVHFPSNLSSTIAGLTGYPTFGGDSSRIVLSFDLPSTS